MVKDNNERFLIFVMKERSIQQTVFALLKNASMKERGRDEQEAK